MTANVFGHALELHVRRHGPKGYNPYNGFKPWLRDEFSFRCTYCLEREMWYPDRAASFSVDHVIPRSEDETLHCEYRNLVYACTRCNSAKQDWRLLDPTVTAFGKHIQLGEDGFLVGLTPDGNDIIDLLNLNQEPALAVRRSFLKIAVLRAKYPDDSDVQHIYHEAFRYPDDMPDLRTMRPPGGNTIKDSGQTCYYARQERNELLATY